MSTPVDPDWYTFYQCMQDELSPRRLYCEPVIYENITTPKIVGGTWVYTRLAAVPFVVPKFFHPLYLSLKLAPTVLVLPKS